MAKVVDHSYLSASVGSYQGMCRDLPGVQMVFMRWIRSGMGLRFPQANDQPTERFSSASRNVRPSALRHT
jgi:hypothetical protein